MFTLESGRPEDYNIPTAAVERLEELLKQQRVHIHGYMLLGGRKVLAERYYAPYGPEDNHRMYSITKSFVALATGLLVKNGLVGMDDLICDHFPEYIPEGGVHPWCAEMTIREMLSMRTCYANTTYKLYDSDDWTESFFRVQPDHAAGTVFSYDTSSAHVLGALVEKLTGMKMLDYLRKEAFDKLGFSKDAYIMEDPVGVSQGGSGLMCTLRDVAGVAYLCNHFGMLDGEELLPFDFMREALSNLAPTDMQPTLDEQCGYGYFFWMPRTRKENELGPEDGFVMYGMGGQLAVCFPKYDFCYLTMADTIGNSAGLQILYDCFYQTVYPYLKERREDNLDAFLSEKEPAGSTAPGGANTFNQAAHLQQLSGKESYRFFDNAQNWKDVTFDWQDLSKGLIQMTLNYERGIKPSLGKATGEKTVLNLIFAVGEWKRQTNPVSGFRCECRADFKNGHLILQCFLIDEEHGHVCMDFAWKNENLFSVRMNCTSEPSLENMMGFASAEKM
ncbi:MAG: serine hydrolase [Acetatifactor sp.]|nr:serine hydrolase [Acetatifactor sp.]